MLSPDARLEQPMMSDAVGRADYHEQFERLLYLVPDLTGTVHTTAQAGDTVYIELTLKATMGGRPLEWNLVDLLTVTDGRVIARRSFFDPTPLAVAIISRPSAWHRWWRSGIGPLAARKRLPGLRSVPR